MGSSLSVSLLLFLYPRHLYVETITTTTAPKKRRNDDVFPCGSYIIYRSRSSFFYFYISFVALATETFCRLTTEKERRRRKRHTPTFLHTTQWRYITFYYYYYYFFFKLKIVYTREISLFIVYFENQIIIVTFYFSLSPSQLTKQVVLSTI